MAEKNVNYVSLYAFSTENFKREKKEVNFLMNLFIDAFVKEIDFVHDHKIKVIFSGRREPLPKKVLSAMDDLVNVTKDYDNYTLNICINYGSVTEIIDMTKKICDMYKDNKITLDEIDDKMLFNNLYQELPPLDLVIRTSGEQRLSNFMMLQASYAELYFTDKYFPEFDRYEFDKAILEYNKRNRRFGGN